MIQVMRAIALAALAALLVSAPAGAASHFGTCEVPPELTAADGVSLPALAKTVSAKAPIRIAVLGSTSSTGRGTSSRDRSYVRRLAGELGKQLPGARIEVADKARESQTAAMMRDRIAAEILPFAPALVVWETGASDAIQHLDPTDFGEALEAGIRLLKARGIDVVLVTPQYGHHTASFVSFEDTRTIMAQVAAAREVGLFRRGEIMHYLADTGNFVIDFEGGSQSMAQAVDGMNGCLAQLLAKYIATAIRAEDAR